jgi:hypothetical protein
MKYLLLSYTPASQWDAATADTPSDEAMAAFASYSQFQEELRASGELVATEGLAHPAVSLTVRASSGAVIATDGPFAELKEVLASFAIIDVVSQDRAVEIVSRIVEVLGEPIEIRPIMSEEFA